MKQQCSEVPSDGLRHSFRCCQSFSPQLSVSAPSGADTLFTSDGFVSLTGHAAGRRVRKLRNISAHIEETYYIYLVRKGEPDVLVFKKMYCTLGGPMQSRICETQQMQADLQRNIDPRSDFCTLGLFSHGHSINPLGQVFR